MRACSSSMAPPTSTASAPTPWWPSPSPARTPMRPRRRFRSGRNSPAIVASHCPCRRSRFSAAARMRVAESTSRTTWWCASAPAAFPRPSSGRPRSMPPRAPGLRNAASSPASPTRAATGRPSGPTTEGARRGGAGGGGYWPAFRANEEGLAELVGAIADARLEPGVDVGIALDIAATQLYRDGRYHLALDKRSLSARELHAVLGGWVERYPIVSMEDPFAEHDAPALQAFTGEFGERLQIVGDDFFVTSAERVRKANGACNSVLLKPNQIGTLTETEACWDAARAAGYRAIVSARSGETEDVSIVHLAVGWGVGQLKVGSFARSERMAKWNEGLRIEEALGAKALPFPARKLFRQ